MPGVMGILQALEAVKVIAGLGETYAGRMLIFDACSAARPFTVMKLRERDTDKCTACRPFGSAYSDVTRFDYEKFTAGTCAVEPKSKLQEFINKEHSGGPHKSSYVGTDCGIPMDTKAKPPCAGDSDQLYRMDTSVFSTYQKKTVIDVRPRHLSQTAMLEGRCRFLCQRWRNALQRLKVTRRRMTKSGSSFACVQGETIHNSPRRGCDRKD